MLGPISCYVETEADQYRAETGMGGNADPGAWLPVDKFDCGPSGRQLAGISARGGHSAFYLRL